MSHKRAGRGMSDLGIEMGRSVAPTGVDVDTLGTHQCVKTGNKSNRKVELLYKYGNASYRHLRIPGDFAGLLLFWTRKCQWLVLKVLMSHMRIVVITTVGHNPSTHTPLYPTLLLFP